MLSHFMSGSDLAGDSYIHVRTVGDGKILVEGQSHAQFGCCVTMSSSSQPDGVYARWDWDGQRLEVENDRHGFFPLYYGTVPDGVIVSNSIPCLILQGVSGALDYAALSVFLRLGFFIGDSTPFRSIRAFPPSAKLAWQDGNLEVSGGYTSAKPESISRKAAVDAYISLFRQSIRRRLPSGEDYVLPLSGGRDSRHILFELMENGAKPKRCVTVSHFPPLCNQDAEVAAQLTSELRIPHEILTQPPSRLKSELRYNMQTNLCTDEGAWILIMADYLRGKTSLLYDGIAGDVLSQSGFLSAQRLDLFEREHFEELAQDLLGNESATLTLLAGSVNQATSRDLAISQTAAELKKHASAPNPVSSFFFWNRTRREIAMGPYGLFRFIQQVHSPYLDSDLVRFLMSLPGRALLDRQLHTTAILRAYPQYAHIPFEVKGATTVDAAEHYGNFVSDFARYILPRLSRDGVILRRSYLLPRLLRALVSHRFASTLHWWFPTLLVLLCQIQALSNLAAKLSTKDTAQR